MSNGNGHRWSKFWWADWQADAALRMCSLAGQGLWMRYLCVAHEATPIGHVVINGRKPTPRQLAAIFGITERELKKLTDELEAAGVFSRTDDGTIYCRRMVRDEAKSDEGRAYVARRWDKENDAHPNTPPNRGPNSKPNGNGSREPATRSSEAEAEAEPTRSPPAEREGGARRNGTNPRASGTNPRATGTNPRANSANPRKGSRNAFADMPPEAINVVPFAAEKPALPPFNDWIDEVAHG